MRKTSSVKVRTKCVGTGSVLLFALAMILLLAAIVSLYFPANFANSEYLLSASMLIGIGGAIRHFLSSTVQVTLLEIHGDTLHFRSHKNPITGLSLFSRYDRTDSIPLSEITAVQLQSIEVPKVGLFGLALVARREKPEMSIWFEQSDYPSVEHLFKLVQRSRRTIVLDLKGEQ